MEWFNKIKQMKTGFISFCIFCISLGVFLPVHGQNINWDGVTNQTQFVRHFDQGAAINPGDFNIGIDNDPETGITWAYCTDISNCENGLSFSNFVAGTAVSIGGGLSITWPVATPRILQVHGGGALTPGEYYIRIRLRRTDGTFKFKSYQFIIRKPFNLVFVLDRSGSMECPPGDNDWPDCSTGSPERWDILKSGMTTFMTKLGDVENFLLDNDRIGVVYFAGSLENPGALSGFQEVKTFRDNINSNMSSSPVQKPAPDELGRDGTSIGRGLLEAINNRFSGVSSANRRKVIVLFTDGDQNWSPLIVQAGGTNWQIQDAGGNPLLTLNNVDIERFAVGIGNEPGLTNLMTGIVTQSGNHVNTMTGTETILQQFLDGIVLNKLLSAFSPEFVRFEEHPLQSEQKTTITCNQNVGRLFFEAHFDSPIARSFDYKIEKDGEDYTHWAQTREVTGYSTLFIINFMKNAEITSDGEWTFTVKNSVSDLVNPDVLQPAIIRTSSKRNKIRLSVTADDHSTDFSTSFGEKRLKVGDKLTPKVELSYRGEPVENAIVTATIIKPGGDIGDMLARAEGPEVLNPDPDAGGCAAQRYNYLQQNNPEALDSLNQLQQNVLQLNHTGNGIYTGAYNNLNVSGIYKVIISIKADIPEIGPIERMKEETVNIRFGHVNPGLGKNELSKDGNVAVLGLKPAYRVGNNVRYVGPGLGYAYSVESNGAGKLNVNDKCDGSYDLVLTLTEDNPRIKIHLLEEEIYRGKVSNFDKPYLNYPFNASLHAGLTFPLTDLDSLYNGGFFVEADFGYRLTPGLALEAVAGYYGFSDNFYILGGTLYAKGSASIGSGGFMVTGAIGGGFYKPKNEDTSAGYSVRLALSKNINSRLALSLDGAWFHLIDPDYSFATLGLGLKYFF